MPRTGGTCACFGRAVVDEALIRFRPDGRIDGFTRKLAETYVRDPASKALDPVVALELARTQAARDWSGGFRAVSAARAVAADPDDRAGRSPVRVRARRGAGRGTHPAAARGERRRTDPGAALRARAGELLAALRRAAQRQRHHRRRRGHRRRRALRPGRLRAGRAVAAAPALAGLETGDGGGAVHRRAAGGRGAGRRAGGLVRVLDRAPGEHVLDRQIGPGAAGVRRSAAPRSAACSWPPRACPGARFPAIRSCGGYGRARPAVPPTSPAGPPAATCSSRSSSRWSRCSTS